MLGMQKIIQRNLFVQFENKYSNKIVISIQDIFKTKLKFFPFSYLKKAFSVFPFMNLEHDPHYGNSPVSGSARKFNVIIKFDFCLFHSFFSAELDTFLASCYKNLNPVEKCQIRIYNAAVQSDN